ncbi:discoidin domain-containing protein [Phytoactinopolyspora mesophila]|nr:discoidin domain-containing protein [Phytoactinopolyspora mesophila]
MRDSLGVIVVAGVMLAASSALANGHQAQKNAGPTDQSGSATVTFTLAAPPDMPAEEGLVRAELICGGQPAATAELDTSDHPSVTMPLESLASDCQVSASWQAVDGLTHEATVEVSEGGDAIERWRRYTADGETTTREFHVPTGDAPQDLSVDVTVGAVPDGEVGTALRVMTFNIWLGGTLDPAQGAGMGEQNLDELLEFVRHEDPDVLFLVETYGAGADIEAALNRNRNDGREFTGVQITREPGQAPDRDNLWLYTWLPVEEVYERISGGGVSSFHFGGARLGLPDGGHVHAFSTWLHHQDNARTHANRAAFEETLGLCRHHTDDEVIGTDERNRVRMATTVLEDRLTTYVGDDDAPIIIGGDLNTLSHLDWSERFAPVFGHGGLVLDWPVTRMFTEAGFTDTYRWAYPDAGRYPGSTMDPARGQIFAPGRIDYVFTRGDDVRVLDSATLTERLPEQQGSALDDRFPFYSDHAAVVTDLVIRGSGTASAGNREPLSEDAADPHASWPDEPSGHAIPAGQLSATASTEAEHRGAERAVDGDIRTHWHSDAAVELPHEITIDMERVRRLSALRYQPRYDSAIGTILRATVQASRDGTDFTDVAEVEWDRTRLPKDVDLDGVTARYLRLQIEHSSGGDLSSAAQLIPYEKQRTGPPAWVPQPPSSGDDQDVVVTTQTVHADCAKAYTESGTWISSNLTGYDGSLTRYSNTAGSTATWVPELPTGGEYEVAVWWPDHATTTRSAHYSVEHADGSADVTIDPVDGMGDWYALGQWTFDAGTGGGVTLTVGSGYHRADALRFRLVEERTTSGDAD